MNSPVRAYTEWDLLEEVIVGIIDDATVPEWHVSLAATVPTQWHHFYKAQGGKPFPADQVAKAKGELEGLVKVLEGEGVKVRRPDPQPFSKPFTTPHFQQPGGLYAAMPRDVLLVVGEDIIESPMAWRSRYFEPLAYRRLLKEYFLAGAKWTAAPKPALSDELYDSDWRDPGDDGEFKSVITEFEPTFDAADFFRCGKDIFGQRSNVTNAFGIEWLRRHLGPEYNLHVLDLKDSHPMHIDASLLPLAPGKLIVNKERVPVIPKQFKGWDVFTTPEPAIPVSHPLYMTSRWINMNVLSIDEKRVVVEAEDEPMIRSLKKWGFTPVPVPFRWFNSFGGSFHCATTDVRRKGTLASYCA